MRLIDGIGTVLVVYAVFVFINLEPNVIAWSADKRLAFVLFSAFVLVIRNIFGKRW